MKNLKSKKAFTLAEVLITLTIVGVIASLTIPSLVNSVNNTTNVVQLKKTYATLQQVFMLLQADNGGSIIPVFQNDVTANAGNGNALNAFLTKLNYVKNCGNAIGCWYNTPRSYLNGSKSNGTGGFDAALGNSYEKAVLANGTMMFISVSSANCTYNIGSGPLNNSVCGNIELDLNGANGPNVVGRDHFYFWVTQSGIYPQGSFNDGKSCSVSPGDWANSLGCATKVLTEGAMNY